MGMFKKKTKKKSNIKVKAPFMERYGDALRRYVRLGATVICSAVMAFFSFGVYGELKTSPYLNVEEVEVSGINRLSDKDISFFAGIERGLNIFTIDAKASEELLESHPYVKNAKIIKRYLNKIEINIEERVPSALVRLDDVYVMDRNGSFFKKYTKEDDLDILVVSGFEGTMKEVQENNTNSLLAFLKLLDKDYGLNKDKVSEIIYEKTYGYTVVTMFEGTKIKFGKERLNEKIKELDGLMELRGAGFKGIKSVDLTTSRGVIVRYKGKKELSA